MVRVPVGTHVQISRSALCESFHAARASEDDSAVYEVTRLGSQRCSCPPRSLALVFAALLVARVLWLRLRQKRPRPLGSPTPSGRSSR
jgi:hypothetical protein